MIRILTLAAAVIAFAAPASAEGVRVRVAGKDAATLHRDLWDAARKVCEAEISGSVLAFEIQLPCMRRAVKAAEDQIAQSRLAVTPSMVASAQ